MDPLGLDRYNPCKKYSGIKKKICEKYVDWACSGDKQQFCCDEEKRECIGNVDFCAKDAEEQSAKCHSDWVKCSARIE